MTQSPPIQFLKHTGLSLADFFTKNNQLPVEVILELRRLLAGLVLFMLVFDLILTFVLIAIIYLHRRRIRKIAAEEKLDITFRVRGPSVYRIYCVFLLVYLVIFIIGTILTFAGVLPIQLSQTSEEILTNIVLILMLVLIVGAWPTLMIVGFIVDIRDQRAALREARARK
jgi:hypothetical protein